MITGTYNNQYMVLDLNKVKLNESIEDGALSVVEQIPGFVTWADQTDKLRLGRYNKHLLDKRYWWGGVRLPSSTKLVKTG